MTSRTTPRAAPRAPDAVSLLDDERLTRAGLFFEAADGVQRSLDATLHDRFGLSGQQFEILTRLARSPGRRLRMCDLATQSALSPSGLTRAVDRLVAEGHVTREHCPEDRRVAWAQLTPEGLTRVEEALPVALEQLDALLFAPLDAGQRQLLHDLVRAVRDHVRPDAAHVSDDPHPT